MEGRIDEARERAAEVDREHARRMGRMARSTQTAGESMAPAAPNGRAVISLQDVIGMFEIGEVRGLRERWARIMTSVGVTLTAEDN
jgi:hypothetical protein